MKKSLLLAATIAMALAASAFASPPPTASPPDPNRMELAKAARDVSPVSVVVADSGSGAESAFKAWAAKSQAQPAPARAQVLPQMLIVQPMAGLPGGGSGDIQRMCWAPGDDAAPESLTASLFLQPAHPHQRK